MTSTPICPPASVSNRPVKRQWRWVTSPTADLGLAFCWVPIVVLVRSVEETPTTLAAVMTVVFLVSFMHQPLTLALVYGDGDRFRQRPRLFGWSPLLCLAAVLVLLHYDLVLLAVVGGLWNAEHTLMQRYGITRIYGRKAGDDHGRVERLLLFALLGSAMVWVAADPATPRRLREVALGSSNERGVEILTRFAAVARPLVVPVVVVTVALLLGWMWLERRGGRSSNPAKWIYMGSTVALVGIFLVDPIAALMGYVGSHAIEYFVIVHHSMGRRYGPDGTAGPSPLRRAVRARPGRLGFLAAYVVIAIASITALQWWAPVMVFGAVYFTLGALHIFFDGFIWKLRDPGVAASLAVDGVGAAVQPLGPNRSTRIRSTATPPSTSRRLAESANAGDPHT